MKTYFEEMRKLSHDDEMRYKLLIQGVKRVLEERKRGRNKLMEVFKRTCRPRSGH